MVIGERLRAIREDKGLSQGDIEAKTGMLRCYTSRVENGHTVPSLETLQKYAHALEIPMYQLFYDSDEAPKMLRAVKATGEGLSKMEQRQVESLNKKFLKLPRRERGIVHALISKMVAVAR